MPNQLIELKGHTEGPWELLHSPQDGEPFVRSTTVYSDDGRAATLRHRQQIMSDEPYDTKEADALLLWKSLDVLAIAKELHAIATQRGINPEVLNHAWTSRGLAPPTEAEGE
jgi:hypothetical protein